MAVAVENRNMLFGPVSVCTTFIKIGPEIGLARNPVDDPDRKQIFIRVARFITIAITIPVFTPISVLYNTICFTIKGTFAVLTFLFDSDILHHSHNEYLNQMNLHVAYAIRELANLFFIAIISIGYTFDPELVRIVNNFITSTIEFIAITEPIGPPPPADAPR